MTIVLNGTTGISSVDGTAAAPALTGTDTNTGIFFPAADTIAFAEGGVESMRIDSSGNVGIGTSSPGAILELNRAGSGAIGPNLYLENGAASATGNASRVSFGIDAGSSASSPTAYIENVKDAAGPGSSYMAFGTFGSSLAERARIDSSGNLLVGTTTSLGGKLMVAADSAGASYPGVFNNTNTGTGNQVVIDILRNSARTGYITNTNTTTSFTSTSDYRLKEQIQPMTGALDRVAALKPVTYKWKVDGSDGQGFIAHELAEVVPDCVSGEKDAVDAEGKPQYQGIDTSFLVATLTAAIQEQQALITSLTDRITALENK